MMTSVSNNAVINDYNRMLAERVLTALAKSYREGEHIKIAENGIRAFNAVLEAYDHGVLSIGHLLAFAGENKIDPTVVIGGDNPWNGYTPGPMIADHRGLMHPVIMPVGKFQSKKAMNKYSQLLVDLIYYVEHSVTPVSGHAYKITQMHPVWIGEPYTCAQYGLVSIEMGNNGVAMLVFDQVDIND